MKITSVIIKDTILWTLMGGQQGLVFTCGGTSHGSSVSIRSTVRGPPDQLDISSTVTTSSKGDIWPGILFGLAVTRPKHLVRTLSFLAFRLCERVVLHA